MKKNIFTKVLMLALLIGFMPWGQNAKAQKISSDDIVSITTLITKSGVEAGITPLSEVVKKNKIYSGPVYDFGDNPLEYPHPVLGAPFIGDGYGLGFKIGIGLASQTYWLDANGDLRIVATSIGDPYGIIDLEVINCVQADWDELQAKLEEAHPGHTIDYVFRINLTLAYVANCKENLVGIDFNHPDFPIMVNIDKTPALNIPYDPRAYQFEGTAYQEVKFNIPDGLFDGQDSEHLAFLRDNELTRSFSNLKKNMGDGVWESVGSTEQIKSETEYKVTIPGVSAGEKVVLVIPKAVRKDIVADDSYYGKLYLGQSVEVRNHNIPSNKPGYSETFTLLSMGSDYVNIGCAGITQTLQEYGTAKVTNRNFMIYTPCVFQGTNDKFCEILIVPYTSPQVNIISPVDGRVVGSNTVRVNCSYAGQDVAYDNIGNPPVNTYDMKAISFNGDGYGYLTQESYPWYITGGDGNRTMTVEITDLCGKTASASSTIYYDDDLLYNFYCRMLDWDSHNGQNSGCYDSYDNYRTCFDVCETDDTGNDAGGAYGVKHHAALSAFSMYDNISSMCNYLHRPAGSVPVIEFLKSDYQSTSPLGGNPTGCGVPKFYRFQVIDRMREIMGDNRVKLVQNYGGNAVAYPNMDETSPTVSITSHSNGQTVYQTLEDYPYDHLMISGTAYDQYLVRRIEMQVNSGAWFPVWSNLAQSVNWDFNIAAVMGVGNNSINVRATDLQGNVGTTSINLIFEVDEVIEEVCDPALAHGDCHVYDANTILGTYSIPGAVKMKPHFSETYCSWGKYFGYGKLKVWDINGSRVGSIYVGSRGAAHRYNFWHDGVANGNTISIVGWSYSRDGGYVSFSIDKIAYVPPQRPLEGEITSVSGPYGWNYEMGYRFKSNENGDINSLGFWGTGDGDTKTCNLWTDGGTLIASVDVVDAEAGFSYASLSSAISVTAGTYYRASVSLAGSQGYFMLYSTPKTIGDIYISNTCYNSSGSAPTQHNLTYVMYGIADIGFVAGGTKSATVTTAIKEPIVSESYFNLNSYPNPFSSTVTIEYTLPEKSNVSIKIYNITGQLVYTLVNEKKEAGQHSLQWNANNNSGEKVPAGTYFYRLTAGENTQTGKMLLME